MEVITACREVIQNSILTGRTTQSLDLLLMIFFVLKERLTKNHYKQEKTVFFNFANNFFLIEC